jgi:uncharacterized protein YlzI (FlbEa/FlbD family)
MSKFIELTRISGSKILISVKNIDSVFVSKDVSKKPVGPEKDTPDFTRIEMASGRDYLVTETVLDVLNKINEFRASKMEMLAE